MSNSGKPKRAALYLRVSTGEQTTENQKRDLEKLADLRGLSVVAIYEDAGVSGAKDRHDRPGLDALLKDARKRRFDIVLFWSVDRLGRSTRQVTTHMGDLDACGVAQFFFKESMDTSTAHGRAMLEMAAVFATLEREMIRERVIAGLARVKATGKTKSGKPVGRPTVDPKITAKIVKMRGEGQSIRKIAAAVGLSVGVVSKYGAAA
jgi:DNA invertase Pin-like site-specific DNA recombinase